VAASCEHGHKLLNFIQGSEFLDYLSGIRFSRTLMHVVIRLLLKTNNIIIRKQR
jgi:hypothetical protein